MTTEKKFSLGEILSVATGCTLTDTNPVPLIEHLTGWECRSDFGAVERFHCAQSELKAQLPWLKTLAGPAIAKGCEASEAKKLCESFVATHAAKYGNEISIRQRSRTSAAAIGELPASVKKATFFI